MDADKAVNPTFARRVGESENRTARIWNSIDYQSLELSFKPVINADDRCISAGNSCFLKPSELAPTTAQLLEELISEYFTPEEVTVVEGDASVAENLLELPWDMIFFTGSKRVGTIVHQAAARHQIPIILELGGKNPCIVDATGVSPTTGRRIVWGKFLNAGQTCIAPDTIYVHQSMYQPFLTMLREQIKLFYGMNPAESSDYGRIAHPDHYNKLIGYLQEGTIWHGGRVDASQNYIEPTLLTDIPLDSELRQAEIFGPILPVIPYSDLNALMHQLEEGPDPLVTYMFSEDRTSIQQLKKTQRTGTISVNQVIRHAANPRIPFGGVGTSGFGRYHGRASIEAFSYEKVYYKEHTFFEMKNQYPPYRPHVLPILRKLRRWLF